MKKAIYLGFVVLLALTVFSCSDPSGAPDEKKGIDAWDLSGEAPLQPGEFFVGYNVGTVSGSRALTAALAKAGSDYFEAVLVYEGTSTDITPPAPIVHRSVFREGKYGRMMPPALGTYDNTTTTTTGTSGIDEVTWSYKAYLFAGRNDDKTLLGIGTITSIDNGTNAGFTPGSTIGQATRGVEFTIEPLETDVTTDPATPGVTTTSNRGTFRPWSRATGGTGGVETASGSGIYVNDAGAYTDVAKRIQIDNLPASIFLLPAQSLIEANYDVKTNYAAGIKFPNNSNTLLTVTDYPPEVIPNGFIWSDGDYAPITVPTDISAALTLHTDPGLDTATDLYDIPYKGIRFPLEIKTNDSTLTVGGTRISSGLGRLSLNVPVVNLTDADADNQQIPDLKLPVVWYIRGGINNVLIDQGKDFNEERGSLGGAILIGVGSVLSGAGGFIIKAGY